MPTTATVTFPMQCYHPEPGRFAAASIDKDNDE